MKLFAIAFGVVAFVFAGGASSVSGPGGMAVAAAGEGVLPAEADGPIGIFENHGDVGAVLHPGSVAFDATTRSYIVAGSGENMWSTKDAFHYA